MNVDVDVIVIGGGPAGATAAALLAAWGRSVVLVHGESGAPSLAESLPASTRKLLGFLGQLAAVDAASFHPNEGNISHWAEQDAVTTSEVAGYHVARAEFDRVLREHARAQGASIVEAHARRVEPSDPVLVECVGPDGVTSCRGRCVLDCSGRAGVIARRGLRRAESGYRTLAVAAEWTCEGWPAGERTHTVVDSYRDGWAWSVPLSPVKRQCTVMLDADRTTIRKTDLERLYTEELQKAGSITSRLGSAVRTGHVWACDASVFDCVNAHDGNMFLVGDAASFVEALSSGGVKKALSSAWTASVVVNTCLSRPSMYTAASDFHDRRERQVFSEYARWSAEFFRDAARVYDDPFWKTRAEFGSSISRQGAVPSDFDLERDANVRIRFEQLRDAPTICLVPDPHLTFGEAPVIEDREVVMREGVVIAGFEAPLRFVAGVNLPELIRLAPECRDLPSLAEVYQRRVAAIDPRELLISLAFLLTRGVLSLS
jgi:flavin-dependent dehydrogenase